MDLLSLIIGLVVGLAVGAVGLIVVFIKKYRAAIEEAAKAAVEVQHVRQSLEAEKRDIAITAEKNAQEKLAARKEQAENEIREARNEIKATERRLEKREDLAEKKENEVREREKNLLKKENRLEQLEQQFIAKQAELDEKIGMQDKELQRISGLSKEEAEKKVLSRVEEELSTEIGLLVAKATEKAANESDEKAKEILIGAIQRYTGDQVSESLVSTVDLPSDEMKGRIIGREGRNIRTFEKVSGTDVVVDDTPGVVVVSAFDPVRREIARRALEKLIMDGRIHPARIEEVVEKTRQETLNEIQKAGMEAFEQLNLPKPHSKMAMLVGRLKFRSSYGQNVLYHSVEVAHLMGMVAADLGLDSALAKRCGLLHDIGKAIDHESEGTHTELGMEVAKRYGEPKEVINSIGSHHEKIEADNIYSILVKLMDAISAGRPGARSETLEKYLKRLEKLEAIATGTPGVDYAYAIQAGREIRVIMNADSVNDAEVYKICRDIAKQIEKELTYPGEIRVTCIRETRAIEVAR
jgi:ribonuclease Y